MKKDDRIELTVEINRDDYLRSVEIFAGNDGLKSLWRSICITAAAAVMLGALGAVLICMGKIDKLTIAVVAAAVIFALYAIPAIISVPKNRRERQNILRAVEKETAGDESVVKRSYVFGRHFLISRFENIEIADPYEGMVRCVEYSDGLYMETVAGPEHTWTIFIPARFLSAEQAEEITARIKAKCRNYTEISKICPAEMPIEAEPAENIFNIDDHKLLSEVCYTPTEAEAEKSCGKEVCRLISRKITRKTNLILLVTMVPSDLLFIYLLITDGDVELALYVTMMIALTVGLFLLSYFSVMSNTKKKHRILAEEELKYGSRIALYEDMASVRVFGDDIIIPYSMFTEVLRSKDLVLARTTLWSRSAAESTDYFAVSEKEAQNADDFAAVLEERINADKNGMIVPIINGVDSDPGHDTPPLRNDFGLGKVLLSARFKEMDVCVKRKIRATELIVNGRVYDERKELIESDYVLSAVVGGVDFTLHQYSSGDISLFAQGRMIAQNKRNL